MKLFKRGNVWNVHVSINKQVVRQSLRTTDKREAQIRANAIERSLLEGSYKTVTEKQQSITLGSYFDQLWVNHYSQLKDTKGVKGRFNTLSKFLDIDSPLETISKQSINNLITAMLQTGYTKDGTNYIPFAKASINRTVTLLQFILNRAVSDGLIPTCPSIPKYTEHQRTRILSKEEQQGIFKSLQDSNNQGWNYSGLLFEFLLETGCRLSEALNLTYDNINHSSIPKTITLSDTKSGHTVIKPLTKRATDLLNTCQSYSTVKPFDLGPTTIRNAWDYAKKAIGKQDDKTLVRHSLRHTTASRLIESGIDSQLVKEYLGHRSIQTTQRYIHLNTASLNPVIDVLNLHNSNT